MVPAPTSSVGVGSVGFPRPPLLFLHSSAREDSLLPLSADRSHMLEPLPLREEAPVPLRMLVGGKLAKVHSGDHSGL